MAEGHSMTVADVVTEVLAGEAGDFFGRRSSSSRAS